MLGILGWVYIQYREITLLTTAEINDHQGFTLLNNIADNVNELLNLGNQRQW